jgi:hypothetical protein
VTYFGPHERAVVMGDSQCTCGWDSPGCGCPRDEHYQGTDPQLLPVQERDDPPIPIEHRRDGQQ